MFYECSCGFTAATATAFYKHLAASKESGAGHQLTQARFSDKSGKANKKLNDAYEAAAGLSDSAAPASWVDEYLMVDQRDTAHQPAVASQLPGQPLPPRGEVPLPVSTAAPTVHQQQQPVPGSELEGVPLKELQGMSRMWSLGRQRSSAMGRPPLPSKVNTGSEVEVDPTPPLVDIDEVELIEHITDPRTSSFSAGTNGTGAGGSTAQAALRMSGSVVTAVVVGLSPWRWFGSGATNRGGFGAVRLDGQLPGAGGPQADLLGGTVQGAAGGLEGEETAGASMVSERGPQAPHGADMEPPAASMDPVHAVRDVLIWRNPWRTSRVFGAGLYMAVCARQLAKGHDLLQPSTAIFALCFMLLLRNVVREAVANYRRSQQLGEQSEGGDPAGEYTEAYTPSQSPRDEEEMARRKAAMLLQQRVEVVMRRVALGVARYGASLVVLGVGLLSGRRATTSALLAALLWLGMVVGELRVMSQPMFWLLCYVATFTIPAAYYRCRRAMDAGVDAALRFAVRVLVSGTRTALLMAGGVAAVLVAVLPLNFVLRASLAGAAGFGVLLWQSELVSHGASAAKAPGLGQAYLGSSGNGGAAGAGGARLVAGGNDYQHRE